LVAAVLPVVGWASPAQASHYIGAAGRAAIECMPEDYDQVYLSYNEASLQLPEPAGTEMREYGARVTAEQQQSPDRERSYRLLVDRANDFEIGWSCDRDRFQFWPLPESLDVVQGSTGETVDLRGTRMSGTTEVTLAGLDAPFRVVSDDLLEVTVPEGSGYGLVVASADDLPPHSPLAVFAVNGAARPAQTARPCPGLLGYEIPDVPRGSTHEFTIRCSVFRLFMGGTATGFLYPGPGNTVRAWPSAFEPASSINRAQLASTVSRLLECSGPARRYDPLPEGEPRERFDDLEPVREHASNINWLAYLEIVKGTGPRVYSPLRTTTRGQVARVLAAAVDGKLGHPLPVSRDLFADDDGHAFEADINRVAQAGIAAGRSATSFDPDAPVTRAEMATLLARTGDLFWEQGRETTVCDDRDSSVGT
jgi:hypothetical protein